MATLLHIDRPRPDWLRVTAFGTSFLTHALAALVVALPLAWEATRVTQPTSIVASLIDDVPTTPLPLPADPEPPARPRAARERPAVAPVVRRDRVPAQAMVEGTEAAQDTAQADAAAASTVSDGPTTPSGASRALAYDGVLTLRYPPRALRQRQQGRVLLEVHVDATGRVERVVVATSSGHAELDAAAREAVQRARFRPVLRNGLAEPAWGLVPIEFRLDRA